MKCKDTSPCVGCSEGLVAFRFFFNNIYIYTRYIYSPTSNMWCKLHVLGCLFLRGCGWKSPARYFRRPYGSSCMVVWLC